jgi:hypothetical protein
VTIPENIKLPALCLAAALLAACGAPRPAGRTPAQASSAAVVFQKKVFKLAKTPDPELEASLEGLLSAGYDLAVKNHSGDKPMEIGFTYSVSPRGAVYPFSEIEVSCIMQEKYSRRYGPELCRDFFGEVGARVRRAVAGKQ